AEQAQRSRAHQADLGRSQEDHRTAEETAVTGRRRLRRPEEVISLQPHPAHPRTCRPRPSAGARSTPPDDVLSRSGCVGSALRPVRLTAFSAYATPESEWLRPSAEPSNETCPA